MSENVGHNQQVVIEGAAAVLIRDPKAGMYVCVSHPNDPIGTDTRVACKKRWWFGEEDARAHALDGRMSR